MPTTCTVYVGIPGLPFPPLLHPNKAQTANPSDSATVTGQGMRMSHRHIINRIEDIRPHFDKNNATLGIGFRFKWSVLCFSSNGSMAVWAIVTVIALDT